MVTLQQPPAGVMGAAWAKSSRTNGDMLPLHVHLDDTALVADTMWDFFLTQSQRAALAANCGGDEARARRIAVFLAGIHDVGKHSRSFSVQVPVLARDMAHAGAVYLNDGTASKDPHSLTGYLAVIEWLNTRDSAMKRSVAQSWATPVGGHHGVYPPRGVGTSRSTRPSTYGREHATHWHTERMAWCDRAAATAGLTDEDIAVMAATPAVQANQILLTGFVILCDWIASNTDLFPLGAPRASHKRAATALAALNMPPRWKPDGAVATPEVFAERFSLPAGASPRPVQQTAIAQALAMDSPGLMIIEAPTGEGKTEAALAAAEILAQRHGLGGMMLALPTCATSDAAFERVMAWLSRALGSDERASMVLTHSKAAFNDTFRGLMDHGPQQTENNSYAHIQDEELSASKTADITAHWWFHGKKVTAPGRCAVKRPAYTA